MQKYIRFPFLFFFLAACIGLLLRWHFVTPVSWLKFPAWLHAHSHLMFLGWIFNLLSLAFIHEHIDVKHRKKYVTLFLVVQVLLMGMLISFPLQGYGVYSIILSTLHTGAIGIFSFWFLRDTNHKKFEPACWFARVSLIFFLVSSLGPFSLAPLMANGLALTKWYYYAVYYYLHFQYNGVFIFGVLSLFFALLRSRGVLVDQHLINRFGYLMFISCFPAYLLSILWANPGWLFNVFGLVAALMQLLAFIYFIKIVKSIPACIIKQLSLTARIFMAIAFFSFMLKLTLQMVSAHPYVAQLAYEIRNYVMAYLHLVLLGMITGFLLGWSIENRWIQKPSRPVITLFLVGFIGMEITLINNMPPGNSLFASTNFLFLFSLMMVSSVGNIFLNTLRYHNN